MRILIIEDNKELANSIAAKLRNESFITDIADNGEKGSFMGRTNEYDLIILDRTLPEKSGLAVCEELRLAKILSPILILSANADTNSKINFLDAGADDYITKPFSFNELLSRIRAVLRRPKQMIEDIIKIDDLTIKINEQTVKRGSKIMYLTKKEFSLLEFLMRNKGIVVSRAMIMEHVWNAESDPFSNTIEAHIRNLRRKKIFGGNKKQLIHNIPGRGYKFDTKPVKK